MTGATDTAQSSSVSSPGSPGLDEHRRSVGLTAGIATNSTALLGYSLDSAIQVIGSLIIVWRFAGARIDSAQAEQRAQKIVAVTLLLLAPLPVITRTSAVP